MATAIEQVRHVHISEIGYGPTGSTGVDHRRVAEALRANGYSETVSTEMLARAEGGNEERVRASLGYVESVYR